MVKRFLTLLLAILSAAVFCSCSGTPAESASADMQETPAPTAVPDPVEGLSAAFGQVEAIHGMLYTLALGDLEPGETLGASADGAEQLHFIPSGRQLEVNMQDAAVRAADGHVQPDIPVSDIVVGDLVTVYLTDSDACAYVTVERRAAEVQSAPGQTPAGGAAAEITEPEQVQNAAYESTAADENALRVAGTRAVLEGVTVTKLGDSTDAEQSAATGLNAALLATGGADVIISGSRVSSEGLDSAGVFSGGSRTSVSIADSEISTRGERSNGLQIGVGGSAEAQDVQITTQGREAAAVRAGGPVTINGGSFVTEGIDSPAVSAAADVSAAGANLRAGSAEALIVEGPNALTLRDCTVTSAMSRSEGRTSAENVHGVLIYSADSAPSAAQGVFSMQGGSLTSQNGDVFFVTNTSCTIELSGVQITNRDQLAWLFNIAGSSGLGWGVPGANGAHADITLRGQNTIGDTRVDSISSMNLHLTDSTVLRGGIRLEPNAEADPDARGTADVVIDAGCTWSLTGNSEVTTLENNGQIQFNGFTVTLGDGTVLSE